jgi:hypothetical protein
MFENKQNNLHFMTDCLKFNLYQEMSNFSVFI